MTSTSTTTTEMSSGEPARNVSTATSISSSARITETIEAPMPPEPFGVGATGAAGGAGATGSATGCTTGAGGRAGGRAGGMTGGFGSLIVFSLVDGRSDCLSPGTAEAAPYRSGTAEAAPHAPCQSRREP